MELVIEWGPLDCTVVLALVLLVLFTDLRPLAWLPLHYTVKKKKRLGLTDVPGPCALPVLGTRWIYYIKYKLNKVHEAYADMFNHYGEIIKEEALWNFPVISVLNRQDIEKVLRQSSKYPLRPPTEVTAHYRKSRPDRYSNLGIINEQGVEWARLRSLLTPELMSARTMSRFLPELNNVATDFVSLLANSRDSNCVVAALDQLACRMGLESTCTLILGRRLGFLELELGPGIATQLADAVKDQFCASRDTFFGLPFWKFITTPAYKKFMRSEETIYDVISELVDEALQEEKDSCDSVESVFMSVLQAPGLDIKDKKAGIIDFIAAGIKTLGNTLVFLLYLIAKNKECQEKLYEEILGLAPAASAITSHMLREAPYLKACITETFRILPTAPCVARILENEMELSGYQLPPGSVVICHTWLACLNESNFKNAQQFQPERWLDSSGGNHPFLVVPFGVGKRMCPGKRFVELELQVVLAQLVRQYEIEFIGDLELEFEFLLAPKSPANFILKERI